jgi:hypothetical protein
LIMRPKIRTIPLGMPILAFRFGWFFCVTFVVGLNVIPRVESFISLKNWSQLTVFIVYVVVFLLLSVVYDRISRTWLLIRDDTLRVYPTGIWSRASRYILSGDTTLNLETTPKVVLVIQCSHQRTVCGPFAGKKEVVAMRIKKCCIDVAQRFHWQLFVDGTQYSSVMSR